MMKLFGPLVRHSPAGGGHEASHKHRARLSRYHRAMIRYRKQNALEPEKDAEVSVNLTPFMFFAVGYLAMKALIGSVQAASR